MQKHHFTPLLILLLFSILLSACQPASAPATSTTTHHWRPTSTPRPSITISPTVLTSTPTLTFTPSPTDTPSNTATPHPPLTDEGPYLAYITGQESGSRAVTIINADGTQMKRVPLPDDPCMVWGRNSISPDGKWFVVYTGFSAKFDEACNQVLPEGEEVGKLQINLLNLSNGELIPITRLLGADYPDNQYRLAQYLITSDPRFNSNPAQIPSMINEAAEAIEYTFLNGIRTFAWSPSGEMLAFAAQLNGDSSNVFLYNLQTRTLSQLTYGTQNIQDIDWSPTGDWLVVKTTNGLIGNQWEDSYFAVRRETGEKIILPGPSENNEMRYTWADPMTLLVYDANEGKGYFDLRLVDIVTGQTTMLWDSAFFMYAFDPINGVMAICDSGLYLVNSEGEIHTIEEDELGCIVRYRGGPDHRFVVVMSDENLYGLALDGTLTKIESANSVVGMAPISPDHEWMIANGQNIYDQNDQYIQSLPFAAGYYITWRPDSPGMFFADGGVVYYVPLPGGDPVQVDTQFIDDPFNSNFFRWIP